MPGPASAPGGNPSITVVCDAGAESASAVWRPIAEAWPAFSPRPDTEWTTAHDAAEAAVEQLGAVVLLVANARWDAAAAYRLIDRLWSVDRPALVLSDNPAKVAALSGRGVLVLAASTPPETIAAMLATLIERQSDVEAIHEELRVARRFQGGLRGEMERLHDELQLAASVQREFLPRAMPDVPGASFHVLFRPCAYVSGDIYDVMRLDDHHVGFFLADAAGHGVPAALMTMVMARALITTRPSATGVEIVAPAEVLTNLNTELIRRQGSAPRFATGVYGVLDTRSRSITLAGAGHPPPLLLGKDGGTPIPLRTDGALLGVFADAEFTEVTIVLPPDQALILYSDGFETAFPESGGDGKKASLANEHYLDRFARLGRTWGDHDIEAALGGLARHLDSHTGSLHQVDDLTALVIVPTAESGSCSLRAAA